MTDVPPTNVRPISVREPIPDRQTSFISLMVDKVIPRLWVRDCP
jgi:hypothetical protein